MSGGYYEYGQLACLAEDTQADYKESRHYVGLSDRNADILREAFHQVSSAATKLYNLTKALDYYLEGDHGIEKLELALVDWLGYNPFPKPLNGMSVEDALKWVDSLRQNKEENTPL